MDVMLSPLSVTYGWKLKLKFCFISTRKIDLASYKAYIVDVKEKENKKQNLQ